MAHLFGDGCDFYSATADLVKKWASNGDATKITFSAAGGRNGGGAISFAVGTATLSSPQFGVAGAGVTSKAFAEGFWFKCAAVPTATASCRQAMQTSSASFALLSIVNSGAFRITSATSGTAATGTKNVCDGQWHWIEWKIDYTTPSATVYKLNVDGVADINGSASHTTPATNLVYVNAYANGFYGATVFMDDMVSYDEQTGPTGDLNAITSFPLGPMQFTSKTTQADGVVGFSTATGGATHYNQINETSADSDTSYVESAVSNDQDLYDFAAMGVSPSTIKTIIANAFVKNPNVGTINFKQIAKSNATQTDGTSIAVPAAYAIIQQSFPQDPNTGAAWASATPVDAATFGVKVV